MRVDSINVYGQNTFKGLWGKSEKTVNQGKTYPYYPFADETDEQIKENTQKSGIAKAAIAIMAALPFTAKEFSKYLKNRLPIIRDRFIERLMVEKNLYKAIK